MLKKTITYEDFNGAKRSEDFYFGYTKLELMEMLEVDDLQTTLERVQNTEHGPTLYFLFKKLVVDAYGVKSDDGRSFVKTEELKQQFMGSPALEELIFGFLQGGEKAAAEFFEACLPAAALEEAKKAINEGKAQAPEGASQLVGASVDNIETTTTTAPKDPKDMTHEELLAAYRERTSS